VFAIYGTLSGIKVVDAIANIRDLGPAIAGLIGGPWVGLGAGLIGAAHRYLQGGFTGLACSTATIVAGLLAGLVYKWRKGEFVGVSGAVLLAIVIELIHMGLTLLFSRPFDQAVVVVETVIGPMVVANAIGMGVFAFIISNLMKERATEAAKRMIEGELQVAREIQMSIVPRIFPPFPDRPEFDINAILEPAKEVGGDFYDFFFIDDDHLFFTIGDVSGKGIPASLFMAVTKTLFRAEANRDTGPQEVIYRVNNALCRDNDTGMFVTVFCGILETRTGRIHYANGGHNPPYVVRQDGSVENLAAGGIALGVIEGVSYKPQELVLKEGELLVMFTDGVTEAMDRQGHMFTEARLMEVLQNRNETEAQEATQNILAAVRSHAGGAAQSDDITIMVLKFLLAGVGSD
ncbi:MAG: PP2C family protein-serine/threonine phosphatase, partial [Bacillota bacterium]